MCLLYHSSSSNWGALDQPLSDGHPNPPTTAIHHHGPPPTTTVERDTQCRSPSIPTSISKITFRILIPGYAWLQNSMYAVPMHADLHNEPSLRSTWLKLGSSLGSSRLPPFSCCRDRHSNSAKSQRWVKVYVCGVQGQRGEPEGSSWRRSLISKLVEIPPVKR